MAWFDSLDIDIPLAAEHRLFKREIDPMGDVFTGSRLVGRPGAAPEEGVENIAETAEGVESVEGAITATVDAGVAETVVAGAFLLIAENLICLVDLLELVLGPWRFVPVGVEFHGFAAEGATNLFVIRSAFDAEGLVVIDRHKAF